MILVHIASLDDLPELLSRANRLLATPRKVAFSNATSLSTAFDPGAPDAERHERCAALVFLRASLDPLASEPARLASLLRMLQAFTRTPGEERLLRFFIASMASPGAAALASLLGALGAPACLPSRDGAVLIEITRPDGSILSAFAGLAHPDLPCKTEPAWRDLCARPEAALRPAQGEAPSDAERLSSARLAIAQSSAALRRRTTAVPDARELRSALLAAHRESRSLDGLYRELLLERAPLLLLSRRMPDGTWGLPPRAWPGLGLAFGVYPDTDWFTRAVREMQIPPDEVAMASMAPRRLFGWALQQGAAVAIALYPEGSSVAHLALSTSTLAALASGQMPG